MIEETPVHRAPQGIALGIATMTVFYVAIWAAFRLLHPAPIYHCRPAAATATFTLTAPSIPSKCKPGDCLCRPR